MSGSIHRPLVLTRMLVVALAVLGLANVPSLQALNFQLRHVRILDDGVMTDHTCFQFDEHTEMLLDLPRRWNTSSTPTDVTSSPPDRPTDQFRLEKSAFTPDLPFQDKGLEAYRARLLATMPKGAQNVRVVSEQADPLPMFGWKDYEFVVDYDFYGQSFRRGTLFINVNPTLQLAMTTTSNADAFGDLRTASFRIMRSWCIVPAGSSSTDVSSLPPAPLF